MQKIYFISGIDTGIGKTVATGLMARSLMAGGVDVITVKLVQTGNDGFSEGISAHRAICGGISFPEDGTMLTAPQIFKFPSSPLLAAGLEGRTVDLAAIDKAVQACAASHQTVLVESAGGLDVPLTEDTLAIDFAAARRWPLILVTCGRLGAINHTLLSIEAAKNHGLVLAGVVHNWHPGVDPRIDKDAFDATRRYLDRWGIPCPLVRLEQVPDGGPYPDIDFTEIFA
jgi:dethiobiotin synthetase